MKHQILTLTVLALSLQSHAQVREVTIEQAFVPAVGFDDNDDVLVTVDGLLNNICYEAVDHQALKTNFRIELRQYAKPKDSPNCKNLGRDLPPHLSWPVPYARTLSLGQLPAGNYTLVYKNQIGRMAERNFKVEVAPVTTDVDNELYAPVSRALIPESLFETQNLQVALSGTIDQNCLELGEFKVERVKDVFVVLPKLKVNKDIKCESRPRPLQQIVNLGAVKPGRYLLHVRSLAGNSISNLFTVLPRQNEMNPPN